MSTYGIANALLTMQGERFGCLNLSQAASFGYLLKNLNEDLIHGACFRPPTFSGSIRVNKSLMLVVAAAGLTISASASAFSTGACAACHQIEKDSVGPAWATVAKDYGSADALAKVFKDGFKVEDRKLAASNAKWKGQAAIMTGQYSSMIKGHEDEAAKALFAAVKAGKM